MTAKKTLLTSEVLIQLRKKNVSLSKEDVFLCFSLLRDAMINAMKQEKRLEFRGFGVWKLKRYKMRFSTNPATGERLFFEPTKTVLFSAGHSLTEALKNSTHNESN